MNCPPTFGTMEYSRCRSSIELISRIFSTVGVCNRIDNSPSVSPRPSLAIDSFLKVKELYTLILSQEDNPFVPSISVILDAAIGYNTITDYTFINPLRFRYNPYNSVNVFHKHICHWTYKIKLL